VFWLSIVACFVCFSWGKHLGDRRVRDWQRSQDGEIKRIQVEAATAAALWYAKHVRLLKMMSALPASLLDIDGKRVTVGRKEVRRIVCRPGGQAIWARWNLSSHDLDVIDVWQFGKTECLIVTTTESEVPSWARKGLDGIASPAWCFRTGDRLIYSEPTGLSDPDLGKNLASVFEVQENAAVIVDNNALNPMDYASIDDSDEKLDAAKAAYAAAKALGPPRSMAVNESAWTLAA
jgi:hypothetical protein